MSPLKVMKIVTGVILLLVAIFSFSSFVEDVAADEIVIAQYPVTGTMAYWTEPGLQYQMFAQLVRYDKTFQVWFSAHKQEGGDDNSIKIVFNDAGMGHISGSGRIVMPRSETFLKKVRTDYQSMNDLVDNLIYPTIRKVIFSTGPLMSSFESYAAKKNDLVKYIEDQLEHGIYKTVSIDKEVRDAISGEMKNVTVAELVKSSKDPGGFERQEKSPFAEYGITVSPVTVSDIKYDQKILDQIATQQKALMAVETAKAQAKAAQQNAVKAEEQGKEKAAIAKWKQEVLKAQFVTEAEQKRDVAKLAKEAAAFTKAEQILLGQGEAERKRLVMSADGALKQKLDTWKAVNFKYAEAIQNYKGNWVPTTVMGNSSDKPSNAANDLIELLKVKTARDLHLNPNPTK